MSASARDELDYGDLEAESIRMISADHIWVLATSSPGDGPTARSMSIVNDGLGLWFQTGADSRKYAQIVSEPRVALCRANMQYEGLARNAGKATDTGNEWFLEEYGRVHPGSYAAYGSLPEERVIHVQALRVRLWRYLDGRPCRDCLEVEGRRAWREWQAKRV